MKTNLTYHREGDYLLPDLIAPESPNIGVRGLRRKNYLLKSRDGIYTGMLLSGTLNAHLEETDRAANEMLSRIIEGMARCKSVTEALKAENQMEWVRQMNLCRSMTEEVVLPDLIYS
jgi:hypothetical protein